MRDVETLPKLPYELDDGVEQGLWFWREKQCNIRYQKAGSRGPAVILIHGFGGNCDHWRKNIGPLSEFSTVYSIDLLGYGYSDKPCPVEYGETNSLYNFYVWADQLNGEFWALVEPQEVDEDVNISFFHDTNNVFSFP